MKFKSFIFATLFTITGVILASCGSTKSQAEQSSSFKIYEETQKDNMDIYCLVDKDTGVNYIVIDRYNGGAAITPRLNTNRTLYLSE